MAAASVARYGVAFLLGGCLVFAGCQALMGADERSPETPTVTPASVPERTSVGVSTDGVDAARLAERHREVLTWTNYTLVLTERLVIDGEPRRITTRRRQVGPDARAYLVTRTERTDDFAPSNYAGIAGYWYDGSTELIRYSESTRQRYEAVEEPGLGLLDDPTEHRTIARMVRAFNTATATQQRFPNGSYRVRAGTLSGSTGIPELGYFVAPRNATLTLTVAPRGFVKRYRVAYTANIAGTDRQVRVVRELRVSRVGQTTVRPPPWAEAARAADMPE